MNKLDPDTHKRLYRIDSFGVQFIRSACGRTGKLVDVWPLVTCPDCQKYRGRIE